MNPSDGAPSRRCFRPCARRKNLPLTLPGPPRLEPRLHVTVGGPLPSPLRQKKQLSRPEAPSTDELPARRAAFTTPLEREPATVPRTLPSAAGFRRSFALRSRGGRTRLRRFRGLFARGRTVPRAARRLLQSKRTTSTTGESTEPVLSARTTNFRPLRDPQEGSPSPFRAAKPSGHGSGAEFDSGFRLRRQLLSVRLRASRALPQPDWLGHLLS